MADTAVAVTTLTANTQAGDLVAGGTSVTAGNTAVITHNGECRNLVINMYAASAATYTVDAGDNPPGQRAGLGALASQSIGAGEVRQIVLEGARFSQDNGTLRINVASNTVVFRANRLPDTV